MSKAYGRMQEAEIEYLMESGWVCHGQDLWKDSGGKYVHGVTQGHAVNAQKQYDRVSPKHPPTRRLVVEVSDNGAVHYEEMTRADAHKFLDEYPLGCEYKEHLLRAELEAKAQRDCADDLAKELLERNKQLSDTEVELEKVREHNRDIERTYDERMAKLDAEHSAVRGRLYQEHKELVAALNETKVDLEKSRAYSKNMEAEHAAYTAKAAQLHTEVCLERNKLRNLNRDLAAEVLLRKTELLSVSSALEESKRAEAELRAQLIERATPEFMQHHMTLDRQVAHLQSECHDLRHRNMTLAGDMSVVRNSLNQANSELREAQEDLKRMTEDKKAAATLLRQALNHIDRLQYSAGTKAEQ